MNISRIKKIFVLLLIIGLIFIQTYKVGATSTDADLLNQILGENGENSSLNTADDTTNNTIANTATNTATNNTTNTVTNNTTNKTSTTLPSTGANENIIIALIVICGVAGVYAFKKVKEYNM